MLHNTSENTHEHTHGYQHIAKFCYVNVSMHSSSTSYYIQHAYRYDEAQLKIVPFQVVGFVVAKLPWHQLYIASEMELERAEFLVIRVVILEGEGLNTYNTLNSFLSVSCNILCVSNGDEEQWSRLYLSRKCIKCNGLVRHHCVKLIVGYLSIYFSCLYKEATGCGHNKN